MKTSSTGALRVAAWGSCIVTLFLGCAQQPASVSLTLPAPKPVARAALGGVTVVGNASFDAPMIDANSWSGTPVGSGQFSVPSTPAFSGGPLSVGVSDSGWHYAIIGDFYAGGTALAVLSDGPWTAGTWPLDGYHRLALVFDMTTGDVLAEADSGTVTLTAAGIQLGQRLTGTLTADFFDVSSPPPSCLSNADCTRGELCQSGVCVPGATGCTSNAQCASGQVCQAGQCVPTTQPVCATDSDCVTGFSCQAGVCVAAPRTCTSDAQCANGETCQRGVCLQSTTPTCTVDRDCAVGEACHVGVCVPGPACVIDQDCSTGELCRAGVCVPWAPTSCSGQRGIGSFSGSLGGIAQCSATGAGPVTVSNGEAWLQDDGGLVLAVTNAASGETAVVHLSACPSAPGALSLQAGDAVVYAEAASGAADTALWVAKSAAAGTLTFTSVGTVTSGTLQLSFSNGGSVTGSFTLQ